MLCCFDCIPNDILIDVNSYANTRIRDEGGFFNSTKDNWVSDSYQKLIQVECQALFVPLSTSYRNITSQCSHYMTLEKLCVQLRLFPFWYFSVFSKLNVHELAEVSDTCVCVCGVRSVSWVLAGGDGYSQYCQGASKILVGNVSLKTQSW